MMERDKELKQAVEDLGIYDKDGDKKEGEDEKEKKEKQEQEAANETVEEEMDPETAAILAQERKMARRAFGNLMNVATDKKGKFIRLISPRIVTLKKISSAYEELEEEAYADAEHYDDDLLATHVDRSTVLEVLREKEIELEDHEIRACVDMSSTLPGEEEGSEKRVNFVEACNRVQIQLLNCFGRDMISACYNADAGGKNRLDENGFAKILNEFLSTNLDAKEIIELKELYDDGEGNILFEECISNIVSESIQNLPSPPEAPPEAGLITTALDSIADSLTNAALSRAEAMMKSSSEPSKLGEYADRAGLSHVGRLLKRELHYLDEYAEKMATGESLEERDRRVDRQMMKDARTFDRDEYMSIMKEREEAAAEAKAAFTAEDEEDDENSPAAAQGEGEAGESKEGDDSSSSSSSTDSGGEDANAEAAEEEDDTANESGTTAVMMKEVHKTQWEKRMESLSDTVEKSALYREARKAQRSMQASNNPIIAKTREKMQQASEAAEDAREVWETSQDPLLWKLRDTADTIFGETEQGYVKGEILRIDAGFDEMEFMQELRRFMIPVVISAFMRGDLEFLRTISSGAAEAALHQALTQRKTLGHVMDSRLLAITTIDVQKYSLEHGVPQVTVMFVCQHKQCIRNAKGDIVEGSPDNVDTFQYVWNLQRIVDNPAFDWEITLFAMVNVKLLH